jgi:D-alanyl-D-alanine carboxypeptidase
MEAWIGAALDYVPRWIGFQLRASRQPGCVIAVAHGDRVVLEAAFGLADVSSGEALSPRHRFRAASHSKSFTAAGVLKLRDAGRLRLDDPAGAFVEGLHPAVAEVRIGQLLSHSAGLVRDGPDGGQFVDRRPYLSVEELRRDLSAAQPVEPELRFKYSNHGYGLLGLIIEAVAGEPYAAWIKREIVLPAGLAETEPDITLVGADTPLATGHSGELPLGRRVPLPGHNPTRGMAAAAGFVSTAGDLARFFAQLSPKAERSVLSAATRREMVRRHWRDEEAALERYYGLGIISGTPGEWEWFGHSGGFQGFITRTAVLPSKNLAISVLTNAIDGFAQPWIDGIVHILRTFAERGAPPPERAHWSGRWWTLWAATDLVPVGPKVLTAFPAAFQPFLEASEIEVTGPDEGRVGRTSGFNSPGEPVRLLRGDDGEVAVVRIGGTRLVGEDELRREMRERYGGPGAAS